jgi:hypothetical protein
MRPNQTRYGWGSRTRSTPSSSNDADCATGALQTLAWLAVAFFAAATLLAAPSRADVLNANDAVVTGFSGTQSADTAPGESDPFGETFIDPDGASVKIRKLEPDAAPEAQSIAAPIDFSAKARDVGQVFAIGLDAGDEFDPTKSTPDIYVGATSAYGLQIIVPDSDGDGRPERVQRGQPDAQWMPGQFGAGGGPGSIWKVDGKNGDISLFATIPDNSGPGIGDIVYDRATRQFFVSDLDTGMIHRLTRDGELVDSYDHGESGRAAAGLDPIADDGSKADITDAAFDSTDSETWGLAPPERMVWGMAMHGGRLYYAVAQGPEVWSVGINLDGTFADDARREFDVPGTPGNFPISDIAFDTQGYMYIAQRGGIRGSWDYLAFTEPKKSVVFRFGRELPDDPETPGIWVPIPDEYAVGFPPDYRNTAGGIALGYGLDEDGKVRTGACGRTLWTTGDNLRRSPEFSDELAEGGPAVVHGLQGTARDLIRPDNAPPFQSYFVGDGDTSENADKSGHVGDVEIWQPCDKQADYGTDVPLPDIPEDYPPIGEPPYDFNLRLDKAAVPGTCLAGGLGFLCDYVVRVTNTGSAPYVGPVVVNDKLPAAPVGAVMTLAPQPPWLCLAISPTERQCTHNAAVLWPGDSVDLFVNVDLPAAFGACHLDNTAGIVWPAGIGDADPGDDFDWATAAVPGPACPPAVGNKANLKIEKFPWAPVCQDVGANYLCRYFVTVRNTGPGVYNGTIKVNEEIPAGTTASFALQPPWTCGGAAPNFTCEHEPVVLNPSNGVMLGAFVTVPKGLAAGLGCKATNKASIVDAAGGTDQNTNPADDDAEATALLPALCPVLPLLNNLKLEKTGPDLHCPVSGSDWACKFKLKITNGANPYTSELQVLDALPFGTPPGATIDFTPPPGWNCGGLFPNIYACSSANPNLAAGASVEIPMTVKVPVQDGTSCTVTNNAQTIKAAPGTLLNIFNGDDFDSASAQLATVVKPDGTFVCAAPAMGEPEPPLAPPPGGKPEEPDDEPEPQCPRGWSKTPVPGKCCPRGSAWDGKRCKRGEAPPEPEDEPESEPEPPALQCWNGWIKIDDDETKSYLRKGYKIGRRRKGSRSVWCAKEDTDTPPPARACPPPAVGTLPHCKCGSGYVGKPPNCRKVPVSCPKGYVGKPPNCRKLPVSCPKGYVGKPPNCRKLPVSCPKGYVGKPPNCRKLPVSCPKGYVGKPPNCRKLPVSCPKGYVGKPPNCRKLPVSCPKGYVGKPPNCRKLPVSCPKGYVGKPPNCRKVPVSCPKGYVGRPPNCRKVPVSCPKGYVGKPPNCKKLTIRRPLRLQQQR